MNKVDEIAQKIALAIEKANSSYIYSSQCYRVVEVLSELRDLISDLQSQSNDEQFSAISTQLSKLCDIMDLFDVSIWSQTSLQNPVGNIVSNLKETMDLLINSFEKINITLTNKYDISVDTISDDLNSLYGKLYDPSKIENPEVKSKLDDIQQYLNKIGKPLISSSQKNKRQKKLKTDTIEDLSSSSTFSSDSDDDTNSDSDTGNNMDFADSDIFTNFQDIQNYLIKKTDYTQDPVRLFNNEICSIYNGKMKLSKEKVTIYVFNNIKIFKRLVNVLTACKHPNLESFVGAVESPLPYTVVTRRNGMNLFEILKRENDDDQNALKPGYRTKIAYQIASAMAYLHSLNITHRDLCTKNIFIDEENNPKIAHFIVARPIPNNPLLMSYKPVSSTGFRAPEITEYEGYTKQVDVFSFAGILYELLMNKTPFSDIENADVESLIRISERPKLPDEISPDLKELIEKCWHQEAKERPTFIDIIQTMLTKSIVFPQDEATDIVNEFYGPKKIKNNDFKVCFQLFTDIQIEINNSFTYEEEAYRIRTLMYAYQNEFQTHEDANKQEINNDNVNRQLANLKDLLENNLLLTLKHTERGAWSRTALFHKVTDITYSLLDIMKKIYACLKSIGLQVNIYELNRQDLIRDYRFLYSIFFEYLDLHENAKLRINEIIEFMNKYDLNLVATTNEVDEIYKGILSNWKDYEVDRSDFDLRNSKMIVGGTCEVFKATQISTKKEVAIKALKEKNLHEDNNQLKILRREIGNLAQLKNDYLVNFIGFNSQPGERFWIITEFIEGGNLTNAKSKLNNFLKTKVAFEIAQGMEYLNLKRIIHRDLKSDNILIDGDLKNSATPKICDFGLARSDLNLLMSNKTGTIHYMAPEVINGNVYNSKADVFSFGLILWELYANKRPFCQCKTNDEYFKKVLKNDPLPYDTKISDDLKKLINDATSFDPLQRPTFTDIINRMLDRNISFDTKNSFGNEIHQFYQNKAKERDSQ